MTLSLLADGLAGISIPGVVGSALPSLLADISGGGYVSIFKAIILIGILLLWCKLLAWADKDAVAAHLPRDKINLVNLLGLAAAYTLVFTLPMSFWLLTPIVIGIFGAEVAVYLKMRDKVVGLKDLRKQWEDAKKGLKPKNKSDGPLPITLWGKSGALPVPKATAADRIPYEAMNTALLDPIRKNAEQIDLVPAAEGAVTISYLVDCVSYDIPPLDSTFGPEAINYIKGAAGLKLDEKRKPQKGKLKIELEKVKRDAEIQTSGNNAGESLRLMIDASKRHNRKMPELGFTPAQLAAIKASMAEKKGLVLLATPKGQGLTQLMYGIMRGHDAFMEHMQSVERDPPETVEGVTPNPLPAGATPDEEFKKVEWLFSVSPDVVLVDKVESPQSAAALINFALGDEDTPGKRVYIGVRAGSSAEAIEQWRRVAGADPRAMEAVKMVICGRVLRKLCGSCKESYTPDPATLRKLNMDPEKVTTLYKARETTIRDAKGNPVPCTFCNELRFKGRQGVFEVLTMTDEIRQGIQADAPAATGRLGANFRTAFRKSKARYLQEEALALVEQGDTSVQEVLRVMKPADDAAPAKPAAARAPAAAGAARAPAAAGARPAAARPAGAPRPPGAPPAQRPAGAPPSRPAGAAAPPKRPSA